MAITKAGEEGRLSCWGSGYWVAHCEGFRVVSPQGRLGIVDYVVTDDDGAPSALAVQVGLWRTHLVTVPLSDVAEVQPRAEKIVLSKLTSLDE